MAARVSAIIDGQDYLLKGEESQEYLYELANLVDEMIYFIKQRNPSYLPQKAAVLACLQLADELKKSQQECEKIKKELDEFLSK